MRLFNFLKRKKKIKLGVCEITYDGVPITSTETIEIDDRDVCRYWKLAGGSFASCEPARPLYNVTKDEEPLGWKLPENRVITRGCDE